MEVRIPEIFRFNGVDPMVVLQLISGHDGSMCNADQCGSMCDRIDSHWSALHIDPSCPVIYSVSSYISLSMALSQTVSQNCSHAYSSPCFDCIWHGTSCPQMNRLNPTKYQCFEWAWEQFCDTVWSETTPSNADNPLMSDICVLANRIARMEDRPTMVHRVCKIGIWTWFEG